MNNAFKSMLEKTDLAAGFPLGTWVMSASPIIAEATACADFDWCVVDMEHTPIDLMQLVHILQALACKPIVPITRVPWNDTVMVKRVLDAGAQTVMFPFVQNKEEAARAAASMRYLPEGVRGMAAMSRGSRYGTVKDYFKVSNAAVTTIVQIETPEAMDKLEEIASVDGVDSLFIGPGDLSGAMGHIGDLQHPEVLELTKAGVKRCHALGKSIGTVGGTPEAVAIYRAMGFDYVACASDLGILMRGFAATRAAIQKMDVQNFSNGY